jgi:hypothetical protein
VTDCAAFLESEQLLRAEGLVVDLRGGFDEILEVGAGEEVAEIDEFAVVLILDWRIVSLLSAKMDGSGMYH